VSSRVPRQSLCRVALNATIRSEGEEHRFNEGRLRMDGCDDATSSLDAWRHQNEIMKASLCLRGRR